MPPIKPSAELVSAVIEDNYVEIEDQEKIHGGVVAKAEALFAEGGIGSSGTTEVIDEPVPVLPNAVVSYRLVGDEDGDLTLMTGVRPSGSPKKDAAEERSAIFLTDSTSYAVPGLQTSGGPGVVSPRSGGGKNEQLEKFAVAIHPASERFIDINDTLNLMARQAIKEGVTTADNLIQSEAFTAEELALDTTQTDQPVAHQWV